MSGFDDGFAAYPRATTWLYDQLTSPTAIDGITGVWEDDAPEGATDASSVWIEFEALDDGEDVMVVGNNRVWTEFPFLVRAISRGRSTAALKDYADAIDKRLHRQSGTVDDGMVIQSTRQKEDHESWLRQGVEYRALGGIYSLIVQPLDP